MKSIYWDHNATTPLAAEVKEAMEPFLSEHFGNPSSLHHLGRIPARALREARRDVARLLGASAESEIVFTSGGTESNNTALRAALACSGKRKRVVTTAVEHSSIRKVCRALKEEGCEIHVVGVNAQGELDLEELRKGLTEQTAVVSLMVANNETGVLFPVEKIGAMVKERGIIFHVDAVQAVGKVPMDLSRAPIDFLSLSAHKFYGPKGVGALYVKKGVAFRSLIFGGSQERGRRGGTENVAGIAGLAAACRLAEKEMTSGGERLAPLRDQFEKRVCAELEGVTVNGQAARRVSNTSNLSFKGVDAEAMVLALDQKGICVSSGSACMSGSHEPSHVLKAMGLSDEDANSAIRFSFWRSTTQEEIESVLPILKETTSRLRALELSEQHSHSTIL